MVTPELCFLKLSVSENGQTSFPLPQPPLTESLEILSGWASQSPIIFKGKYGIKLRISRGAGWGGGGGAQTRKKSVEEGMDIFRFQQSTLPCSWTEMFIVPSWLLTYLNGKSMVIQRLDPFGQDYSWKFQRFLKAWT